MLGTRTRRAGSSGIAEHGVMLPLLEASCGVDSVTAVAASAVGAVAKLSTRPAFSVVGRVLLWRSAANLRCVQSSAGRPGRDAGGKIVCGRPGPSACNASRARRLDEVSGLTNWSRGDEVIPDNAVATAI